MTQHGSDDAVILHSDEGVVETSYSCVVVRTFDWGELGATAPEDNTLVTVPELEEGEGDLWVNTADQWGPFSVTTRLWSARPADPGEEWEDVVELSVTSGTGLFATEMVDNEPQIILAPEPGEYRLRVSARGRRIHDISEDDDLDLDAELPPKEWYLLEAWPAPATDPVVVRLTSPFADRVLNPPPRLVIPEGEAGLAAAGRIGRDVDGAPGTRTLSGETGTVRVERTIRGTRRRLFGLCSHLVTWSHVWLDPPSWSWSGGGAYHDEYAPGHPDYATAHDHPDQMSGRSGAIRTSYLEVEKPARAVRQWDWVVPPPGGDLVLWNRVPFLPEPTVLAVELTQSRDEAGEPWATIVIEHDGLPVEWLDDMETYWGYQLSIADHAGFGVPK
ncbi:hypothetical protein [Nocardioides sp. HB32]